MSPDFATAARTLLAGPDNGPRDLADRAVNALERVALHLATLLGDSGVQMLVKRSVVLASEQSPWLPVLVAPGSVLATLRAAMEQQDRDSTIEAFAGVLTSFVGLLERLIGEGLVVRLLDEVWPTVFTHAAKDTP